MKKVFLSFACQDAEKIKRLLPDLESGDYELIFYDGFLAVDAQGKEAAEVKNKIGEKIVQSQLTLCLIGENTFRDKWVDCQLEKSRAKGNRIIAMALKGVQEAVLPDLLREENLVFQRWDPFKLRRLISEK